jgi:hypothetical protein
MRRHPNGWTTESLQELAKSPEYRANLLVLQRIAERYRALNPPQWWIDVHAKPEAPPVPAVTKGKPAG